MFYKDGFLYESTGEVGESTVRKVELTTGKVVQRHDLPIPGREAVQVRVDFDPGAGFPRHRHPGEEIAYVLEGTVEYRLEGQAPVTLKAGDSLFIPAGTVHAARNVGNGNASELATYIIEKGKPPVELLD